MKDEIDYKKIWKLPEDLKKRVVLGKTRYSRKEGDISFWIAVALNRLDTHDEMRAIAKQIHPTTEYREFTGAIRAYLASSKEVKKKVCEGKIDILELPKKNVEELSEEDKKNIDIYKNAKDVQTKLSLFYKDLLIFMRGSPEDRDYLRKVLNPEKIGYIASILSCIRDEELWLSFIKHQKIKEKL